MEQGITEAVAARIELFGFPPTPARLTFAYFPRGRRLLRAARPILIALAVSVPFLIATLGVDLVFTPLALLIGAIFARKSWKAAYEVRGFEGSCPRCGQPLSLESGKPIAIPHAFDCYGCHTHPRLVAELPEAP
jgi:hypothetical protein